MARLVVESVTSANAVRRALLPGDADTHGEFDGETLVVDDADAQTLVDTYPNVRWADADRDHSATVDQHVSGEAGAEGATYYCGVNDCSREVDSPTGTCWQHTTTEDDPDA
jgi:hypothetical protein